ncbi:ABC transporter permease [Herbidospora yilanensis]|uniref:ABC transporter permease n=1 Tax=Herbidospora yilanensis TaxID=354426 RepID=UPI0007848885|nr:ABC transporter permease [Herbidospora yilanensis]
MTTDAGARPALRRLSGAPLGLLALIALFTILRPTVFPDPGNLSNLLEHIAVLAIVACAQTVVMAVADFDLSVGATASFSGVIAAQLLIAGWPTIAAVAAAIATGVVIGLVNGWLVAYLNLSAFVATLATMTALAGGSLLLTDGSTIFGLPGDFLLLGQGRPLGVPAVVLIAITVGAVIWFLLSRTAQGRRWHAVGGNAEAAAYAGIDVGRTRLLAFVVSGAGAALAGLLLASRLASAHPTAGDPLMLTSIAAVFIGLTAAQAARPGVVGTLLGVVVLGVLDNGLNLLDVNPYVQQILTGLIIVVSVGLSRRRGRRS